MNKILGLFLLSLATFSLFSADLQQRIQHEGYEIIDEAEEVAPAPAAQSATEAVSAEARLKEWFDAVRNGDLDKVQRLIKEGVDIDAQDELGDGVLSLASLYHRDNIFDELIKAGANVNIQNDIGSTVLWLASWSGDIDIVLKLIKAGANVNLADNQGNTPLIMASKGGQLEVIKILLMAGADPSITNKRGGGVLSEAGYLYMLDLPPDLLRVDQPTSIEEEFINAVIRCDINRVEFMLNSGIDVNAIDKIGDTALIWASCLNYPEIVALLLQNGADKSIKNKARHDALHLARNAEIREMLVGRLIKEWFDAVQKGDLDNIQRLIKEGVDIDAEDEYNRTGSTALIYAAKNGKVDIVKLLLDKGCRGDDALIFAAERGHSEIVKLLLDKGCRYGDAALFFAAEKGHSEIVKLLLEHQADMDIVDWHISEVLYITKSPEIRSLLSAHYTVGQAAITTQAYRLSSLERELINAVKSRNIHQVQFLIEAGVDVNTVNVHGDTLLILAACYDYPEIVALLLQNGADKSIKNRAGKNALSATRNSEIRAMLGESSDEAGPAPVLSAKRSQSDMGAAESAPTVTQISVTLPSATPTTTPDQIGSLRFYNAVKDELAFALIKHDATEQAAVKRQILRLRETNSKLTTSDLLQLPYPAQGNESGTLKTYLEQLAVRNGLEYDALEGKIDNLFY